MGSGRGKYYRLNRAVTIDQIPSIDLRFLKKEGVLQSGGKGILDWTIGDTDIGRVAYNCDLSGITLRYGYDGKVRQQRVNFDLTSCNYGGSRKWFVCPACQERSVALYLKEGRFACRSCHRLAYRSSNETKYGRILLKKHKLGYNIFEDYQSGHGSIKKKGMNWKRFMDQYEQYIALSNR